MDRYNKKRTPNTDQLTEIQHNRQWLGEHDYTVENPHCGCPLQDPYKDCYNCTTPNQLQVRILYPPTKCVKVPCNYRIPAVDCRTQVKRMPVKQHVYDLTVQEPGPNDSYGRDGLNWWDWQMWDINKKKPGISLIDKEIPDHPYLSKVYIPREFPMLLSTIPTPCHGHDPALSGSSKFLRPVTYSKNWRSCSVLGSQPWIPPASPWATNQHL